MTVESVRGFGGFDYVNVKEFEDPFIYFKEFEKVSGEDDKWAEIGRKPGEYKQGDIVQVTAKGAVTGEFRELLSRKLRASKYGHGKAWYTRSDAWLGERQFELVTPVEKRFDNAKGDTDR